MPRIAVMMAAHLLLVGADALNVSAVTINVDTVLGPDNPYRGYPIFIEDGPNPPTRVTVLPGFQHRFQSDLDDYYNGLILTGRSEVNMLGGDISGWEHPVTLWDQSRFHMTGGETAIEAYDRAEVNIEKDGAASVIAYGQSRVRFNTPITGRDPAGVAVRDNAHAVLIDGDFGVQTMDSSTMVIRGGAIEAAYFEGGNTLINGDVSVLDMSVSAGAVHLWSIAGSGSGREHPIHVGRGMLHVYGTDLQLKPSSQDPNLKVIAGFLADGDPIGAAFAGDPTHVILHEVPEPGAIALCCIGLSALVLWRLPRKSPL